MAALAGFRREHDNIIQIIERRRAKTQKELSWRQSWIKKDVMPALENNMLLAGLPRGMLRAIAEHLHEVTYRKGDVLATAGQPTSSMFVLLDGEAIVESRAGEEVGKIAGGA